MLVKLFLLLNNPQQNIYKNSLYNLKLVLNQAISSHIFAQRESRRSIYALRIAYLSQNHDLVIILSFWQIENSPIEVS